MDLLRADLVHDIAAIDAMVSQLSGSSSAVVISLLELRAKLTLQLVGLEDGIS